MKKNNLIFLLIIIGLLVYFKSLFNGFVWDDEEQVVANTLVHSIGNFFLFFQDSTFNTGGAGLGGIYYKPMLSIFFAGIYSFFGGYTFFFHFIQLTLHLVNSIFTFLIFDKLLKKTKLSFMLALIFLVHPINAESVVYISALQDALFFFFGILAFFLILKKIKNIYLNSLVYFLLLFSLLSKETGILFFVIISCYFLIFEKKRLISFSIFSFLILALYSLLRFGVADVAVSHMGVSPIMRFGLGERLINIPSIIFFYLKTFFFPKDLAISQHWMIHQVSWNNFYLPLILVLLFMAILLGYFIRTKNKLFLFFFIWFIVSVVLHIQVFPLDMTVAERWFYLPLVGMLGMLGIMLFQLLTFFSKINSHPDIHRDQSLRAHPQNLRNRLSAPLLRQLTSQKILVISLITTLSIRTFIRTFDWKDGMTLYTHDVKISKQAFDLENNLGVELYRAGRIDEASTHFASAIKLAPYWWTNWNNMGAYFERKRNYKKAEEYYLKAIMNGDYYLAYENYISLLIREKKLYEAKKFLEKRGLVKLPNNEKLQNAYLYLQNLQKNP